MYFFIPNSCGCSICPVNLFAGPCMRTAGVVSHVGWFPSAPCCGGRYSLSSNIIYLVLVLTGDCNQRAAPCSKPGIAGRDLQSDTNTSDKGRNVSIISLNSWFSVSLRAYCFKNRSLCFDSVWPTWWQMLPIIVLDLVCLALSGSRCVLTCAIEVCKVKTLSLPVCREINIIYWGFTPSLDVNVRVTVLTLYGALVTTQAPLPEVQLLLQQPEGSGSASSSTPGDSDWRQRDNISSTAHKPVTSPQKSSCAQSPGVTQTPAEEGSLPWLMQMCATLITQPREDHSDSEGAAPTGSAVLEPLPVRLEALQVRWWGRGTQELYQHVFHLFFFFITCLRSCATWSVDISLLFKVVCVRLGEWVFSASKRRNLPYNCMEQR